MTPDYFKLLAHTAVPQIHPPPQEAEDIAFTERQVMHSPWATPEKIHQTTTRIRHSLAYLREVNSNGLGAGDAMPGTAGMPMGM